MASENIKDIDTYDEMQNMLKKTYLPDLIYVAQVTDTNTNWSANADDIYLLFNSATKNRDTFLGCMYQYTEDVAMDGPDDIDMVDLQDTFEYCISCSLNNDVNDIIMKISPFTFLHDNDLFTNNNHIDDTKLQPTQVFLCNEFVKTYGNVFLDRDIPDLQKKIIDESLIMKTKLHNKYKQNILSCINLEEKALIDIVIDYLI